MSSHPPFASMPFMEAVAPLLRLFNGMTRKGPGSRASTLQALSLCPLPPHPCVADFGCGSGASALLLAEQLQCPVLALDADGTALDDLWANAQQMGLGSWIQPTTGDLGDPPVAPQSLDLIWSEGAITHIGWAKGLATWMPLLRPGGMMAITDATWFEPHPPEEALNAWSSWYPEMATVDANLQFARELGLQVLGHFRLPRQDWWDYFDHVEAQCRLHQDDASLAPIIEAMHEEMALYRRCGDSYGYEFYVLKRP